MTTGNDRVDGRTLVLGLGRTGYSVCRHLHRLGVAVEVADSRTEPPAAALLAAELPELRQHRGGLPTSVPEGVTQLVVSPGLLLELPLIVAARKAGLEVIGDIELFARAADAPAVAVTGSNGKSTVVTLLALMIEYSGREAHTGGNLGTPALDLLAAQTPDLYLLELSSFQLDLTHSLQLEAAAILNLSPDHIDRHGDMDRYAAAKARILHGCACAVLNRDDARISMLPVDDARVVTFGADEPHDDSEYGIREADGHRWLVRGQHRVLTADELRIAGQHNELNVLAALAMAHVLRLSENAAVDAARAFVGLPHRTEWVAEAGGVTWYNDSKATNVGAASAAITGMDRPLVLIAGGDAKGADLSPLRQACEGRLRAAVLVGRDADALATTLDGIAPLHRASGMQEAVTVALTLAEPGDAVLLSPACASTDMYADYTERGRLFSDAVAAQTRQVGA
jgi:UDP-N-acetylmuramoylalanine--D-glutamate ligase